VTMKTLSQSVRVLLYAGFGIVTFKALGLADAQFVQMPAVLGVWLLALVFGAGLLVGMLLSDLAHKRKEVRHDETPS
jgi:uncharacterized membrane protein YciS (DUF1049 family)